MKRKITITYEVEVSGPFNSDIDIAQLVYHGTDAVFYGREYKIRDATLAVEALDDCPVYTAAATVMKEKT